ncbi:MAG: Xaa-Pro peptidase family protein [Zestosphaera sp.]
MASYPAYLSRISVLQERIKRLDLECAVIRTLSDFKYLMGFKWLRPMLLIPADGPLTAFVARGEEDGFLERSKIRDLALIPYTDGSDLMGKVSSAIRTLRARKVGMAFRAERDSYVSYHEMFKSVEKSVEVVDISPVLSELRALKDDYEIELIRKAGEVSSRVLEEALSVATEGSSETDIAAEAYRKAFKLGSEEPLIYVNVGPHPRAHAEPMNDVVVKRGVLVTVVVASDHEGYYANTSASMFVGSSPSEDVKRGFECVKEAYVKARESMRAGRGFHELIKGVDEVYMRYGLLSRRLTEYVHGVGLRPEEYPVITTTSAPQVGRVKEGMVLASVHTPLMLKGCGSLKLEDTFIVTKEGLEEVTKARKLIE